MNEYSSIALGDPEAGREDFTLKDLRSLTLLARKLMMIPYLRDFGVCTMAVPGIDRFLNIRSALGPTFSPDGRFLCFLTNITGVAQVWQIPIEGGWPTQLTFTRESVRGVHFN